MSRKRSAGEDEPGQDSFLDIVANLVGIMIILVIVVGVQAKGEMGKAAPTLNIPAEPDPDVDGARQAADAMEKNLAQLENKLSRQLTEIKYRELERGKLSTLVAALEKEIETQRAALNDQEKALFDKNKAISSAQTELAKLVQQANILEREEEQVEVIQHLPSPMAKTVFGRELHFRLVGGKLTYIPWEELIERLKRDARSNAWKLKDSPSITETVGPVRNFMMRYTIERKSYAVQTRVGAATQNTVQLDSFEIHPIREEGEPVDQALGPDSHFNAVLGGFSPAGTTVTVWAYPDSFDDYRKIQKSLFDRGYLCAARPMPTDTPIGGSPRGTRTAAQ